ncbi:histidinol-phosphatase [Bifidobacterium polysaccharolyticum]|uniref:histidinol-phosphatase n=1 Tax=Bifidobacterium polysaccharolyticum TaxID=2750967 RepID=UPI0018DCC3B2|nr:histidinol-phosphatase [Bifidobacterium polysaccharolyticum]MBI0063465.1 histidinol-phosphatase [Bifidobacterium polysaccharolyticum]
MSIEDERQTWQEDLDLAIAMADQADQVTVGYFKSPDLKVERKEDNTPVTQADKEAEAVIRRVLARARPNDTIYAEELGKQESNGRRWIIDPIDGTKNYVRGVPVWATLIGLEVDHQMVVGAVSAPMLGTRWYAAQGQGACMARQGEAPKAIHVSRVDRMEDASMSLSSLTGWKAIGRRERLLDLTDRIWRLRGFGDFWQYMLLAQGAIDLAAEPELDLYDMGALVPIVTEAGGSFTDLAGNPGPWGGSGLASNGLLHKEALAALGD